MNMAECICKNGHVVPNRVLSMKCYKFIFHLDDAVSFGGDFVCMALDETDAWRILEAEMPDAIECVKAIKIMRSANRNSCRLN